MMGQLLSKDILYEPMKELSDKVRRPPRACPGWGAAAAHAPSDRTRG